MIKLVTILQEIKILGYQDYIESMFNQTYAEDSEMILMYNEEKEKKRDIKEFINNGIKIWCEEMWGENEDLKAKNILKKIGMGKSSSDIIKAYASSYWWHGESIAAFYALCYKSNDLKLAKELDSIYKKHNYEYDM